MSSPLCVHRSDVTYTAKEHFRKIWSQEAASSLPLYDSQLVGIFGSVVQMPHGQPLLPQQVGMWKDGNGYSFGAIFGKIHTSPEMLGMWIIPISGLAAALAYFAATELMRQSGRLILSRRTIDLPR